MFYVNLFMCVYQNVFMFNQNVLCLTRMLYGIRPKSKRIDINVDPSTITYT